MTENHGRLDGSGSSLMKVLFFVEGHTDIRFVTGLSGICSLTLAVPMAAYANSGLKQRIEAIKVPVDVVEIRGGRLRFQLASFVYLLKHADDFHVILCQEVLRGALNATIVGKLKRTPVVTYMGIAPVEYFRCRRERGLIGPIKAWVGELVIRSLMKMNGMLTTRCLAMGPYLKNIAVRYCPRTEVGLYYGVDTDLFRPANEQERNILRRERNLPVGKFIIFLSSRMSHEKDPETVLRAADLARRRGLDAVVVNLGGGYKEFLKVAGELNLTNPDEWVLGRPAAHPMTEVADYFRCVDAIALASLAEGAAFSTLESLACGTPVVCTAVGGMEVQLRGYARLTPRQDPEAMCN
jgi:glycosyltransferase involved in cell wall biosynthesis